MPDTGIDSSIEKMVLLYSDKVIMGKEEQLWTAVRQENVQKLCEIFEQNNAGVDGDDILDVNHEDSCERTPLMWAAHGGNVEVVQLLLENGAASISSSSGEKKKKSKYGWTALHGASMHGHCDVARVLLEHAGGKGDAQAERLINAKTRPAREVPLHVACQHGHISIVDLLLLEYNANILDKTRAGWSCLHYASHYAQIEIAHRLLQQNTDLLFCKDLLGKTPLDVSKNTETSVAILLAYHEYTQQQPNTLLVSDLNKALSSDQDISMIVVSNAERILQEQQQEQQEEAKELLNLVKQEQQKTQDTIHEFMKQTRQEQSYDMQAVLDKMQHQQQQRSQSNLELTRMLQGTAQKLETMQESVAQHLVQRNDQHQMELNLLQERMARYEQQQQDQKQEQSHHDKDDQEQQLALASDTNPTSTRVLRQYEQQEPLRLFISLLLSLLLHVPLLLVSRAAHSLESLAKTAAATPPSEEEHNKQDYDALKLERDQLATRLMRQQQIANLAASSAAECYAQQENDVVTLRQHVAQLQAQNDYLKQQQQQLNRRHQHEQQDKCDSREMADVLLLDHISTNTSMMSLTTGSITSTSEDEADDYEYDNISNN
jgi:hypothetical protein